MVAIVAGYLAAGTIDFTAAPFSTSKSVHDLLPDTLETLWTLIAVALAFTDTARRHLQRSGEGQADVGQRPTEPWTAGSPCLGFAVGGIGLTRHAFSGAPFTGLGRCSP